MKKLALLFVLMLTGCAPKAAPPTPTATADATAEVEAASAGKECMVPGTNRCIDYEACSLQADLRGASGETLEMYKRERKENDTTYTDHPFPVFEAKTLKNETVSSQAIEGRVVYVLLAAHCQHSFDSVAVMNAAVDKFGERVKIVGVVVNSGSVDDVSTWYPQVHPKFDVWVHPGTDIGDQVGSHLVPSWFFVEDGQLERKLVGFQTTEDVDPALTSLTGS